MRLGLSLAAVLAVLLAPSAAHAQSAPPLTQSDFSLELYRGPVQGSARVIGLAGAFTAVAEESVALQFNPAAAAQRTTYSLDWFDWLIDWDFLVPGLLQGDTFDFNGSGYTSNDNFLAYAAGGGLQFGNFGFGLFIVGQLANLQSSENLATTLQTRSQVGHFSAGYSLLDHQLILGAGARVGYVRLEDPESRSFVWSSWSLGLDAGAIIRPRDAPFRFGLSVNSQTFELGTASCSADTCSTFIEPQEVVAPWSVRAGVAWFHSFDGRAFNASRVHSTPTDETQALHARRDAGDLRGAYQGGRYVQVSFDLNFVAPVPNAIGIDGLTRQERLVAGNQFTLSVHLGVEAEVLWRRLRLRAGSYWDPSRYEGQPGRLHGTAGWILRMFDFKLPLLGWNGLSFQVAVDVAWHYTNLGLSLVSFWH